MRKKLLSLLLAVTVPITTLVGCGASKTVEELKNTSTNTETTEKTDKKESFELTMWVNSDGLNELDQEYVDKYNEMYPEHPIKLVTKPEGDGGELMAAMMSGTAPDILILSYPEMHKYIYADALRPLDEYFDKWDDFSNINENMVDKFKVDSKSYGLPAGEYAMSFFYNKVHFEESGIEVTGEWTWDALVSISKELTDTTSGQYGFALDWNQWAEWWFQMFVWGAGGDLTTVGENGELVTTFTDPAVIKAAELYRTLKNEKAIQTDMSIGLDQLQQDFASGKASIIYHGLDNVENFISKGMNPDDIGVLQIPIGPGGENPTQLGGSCYVMHAKVPEEKMDAVFKYYELVSSQGFYEDRLEYFNDQGFSLMSSIPRTDVNAEKYLADTPDDMKKILESSPETGKVEFYGKAVVGSFVDKAIQKMFVNTDLDIEEVFKEAEVEANKQVVPDYNKAFK